ncbi:hypothetical protein [Peptostreptococcus equinus]|uniref:Uncharacterized protein n=1 Tax=Peptostreptococcus equinus TaxID=3003601 RepID=A0ABY7JUD0_9FIRM|nr:hypothetical protein [Peptostreptococcus sp. CBA3647]WAW15585.1 hypothetical protein O0R46_03835 [Peptostreptococcus sp. CBA3647]
MEILQLDLNTRYTIYAQTKKVLRKYQKGIVSGKLTSEQFVISMLKDKTMISILDNLNIDNSEFRETYKSYVDTLISMQNDSLLKSKENTNAYMRKAECSSIFKLNKLLKLSGFNLTIPDKYLTQKDIECIEKYVKTGDIDLGNEKIFNYVTKQF